MLVATAVSAQSRPPNEMGHIPILEYHLITDKDSRWGRSADHFRRDLKLLYDRGYRPINVSQMIDKQFDIPAGTSPVVFTFDDASPGQFSYIEKNGQLEIDPNSAVGIWLDFSSRHPDWGKRATFCLLSGAAAGHAFFGDKGIEGQKTEQAKRVEEYVSPPLTPGKQYFYEVRARWTDTAGKEVERTRSFPIVPGQPVLLDFTRPAAK